MTRDTRFRGKHIVTGAWQYGYLLAPDVIGKVEIFESEQGKGTKPHIVEFCIVDPDTVGQCTGLHDRNGVEIYEGDILRGWTSQGYIDFLPIEWGQNKLRFYAYPDDSKRGGHADRNWFERVGSFEVIGNHWDNPELLKETA